MTIPMVGEGPRRDNAQHHRARFADRFAFAAEPCICDGDGNPASAAAMNSAPRPHDRPIGPFLYLPIEVASRELHAKLLLSYFAVDRGYEVVVGWKRVINKNLRAMPPGIVMFKTLTARDGAAMAKARAAGHRIAALDEEVPGLVATKQKLRWVAKESVAASDLIFAVGEDHLDALRQFHPAHADRYRVVGNPRWDLLRPELRGSHAEEVAAIRRQYGRFILINTNFAILNSSRRTGEETRKWFADTGRVDLSKPEDVVFLDEIFAMERANTAAVHDLIRALPARFPDHRGDRAPASDRARWRPGAHCCTTCRAPRWCAKARPCPGSWRATCSSTPTAPPASRPSPSTSRRSRCGRRRSR